MDTAFMEDEDRRGTSIHEAAHLTAALALGGVARAYIWREGPATAGRKGWRGQCQSLRKPRGVNRCAVLGIAGVIGNFLFDDPDIDCFRACEYIDMDSESMSDTDMALIKASRLRVATLADRALQLLREHRDFWEWATRELFENKNITDAQAIERFPEPIKPFSLFKCRLR